MPTSFATTKNNNDSITVSLDTHGLKASSSIFLNNHLIKTMDDSFNDFFLGTNLALMNNIITIVTQVFRFPANITTSKVDYFLTGAVSVSPNNPESSVKNFQQNIPVVPHTMTYFFI